VNSKIISTEPFNSDFLPADEASAAIEMAEMGQFLVDTTSHHQRLDKCLSLLATGFSRSYLQTLIAQGDVQVNGVTVTKPALKVNAGDVLVVYLRPTPASTCFKPEAMALDVIYEDEHLIVINKPAGLVVHPAPGNWGGTVLNAILHHAPKTMDLPRAGIVHRLDKLTSGLMVIAKTRPTMDALVKMIAARHVYRYYLAVAKGRWTSAKSWCVVNHAIGRDPVHRLKMAVLPLHHVGAKTALTAIRQLASATTPHHDDVFVLACKLFTGRTHQIRVHLSSLGLPIVGDDTYGGTMNDFMQRQALHATCLQFQHPVSGVNLCLYAPLPPDIQAYITQIGVNFPDHVNSISFPELFIEALQEVNKDKNKDR
jgi:23S rRNA pseudouridine1911/1915/1917 synthase